MGTNKIIFFLPSIKTGGGNRVCIELANQIIQRGIDVHIVYPNNSKDINTFKCSKEIKFIRIGVFSQNKLKKLNNVFKTLFYINKNYIQENIIFTDPILSIFIPLVRGNKISRFVQADDYNIYNDLMVLRRKSYLFLYRLLTKKSYTYHIDYLFNSKYTYDKFIEISYRKDIDYKIIYPAINQSIFFNRNIRDSNKRNLCIIARKHPLKGFIDFITLLNEEKLKRIDNIYVISHDDLSEFDLTRATLIKPRNDDEISYYMNISHIFVSTSWWEGFGLPSLEAMACGCAVVLTNAGGVNEYAIANENCLMYLPKDRKALEEHIIYLLNNNQQREKLSKNGEIKSSEFSWKKSTQKLLIYLNINQNKTENI